MSDPENEDRQLTVGTACFRCRGFRHACDREKPACSRCHKRGIECVYPEAAPTLKSLQQATESLGDRLKKFSDQLKEKTPSITHGPTPNRLASANGFSLYPCVKCAKDLQQCDLTLPTCSRCESNHFDCIFQKTEPKANHVSQVLATMNKVMDNWQKSIIISNLSLQRKRSTDWRITTTKKGLSVESNVHNYNDFSTLVKQFKLTMTSNHGSSTSPYFKEGIIFGFNGTRSIHPPTGFAVWNQWAQSIHATLPQNYPIDTSKELTDNLVELYCRTPCCSSIRLPIIDTEEFLKRYRDVDPTKRPSTVLVYAICAMAARNAFQLHVWSKRPAHEAPKYNMGKALSVAYCLRGRELLSECFDEPSFEHCKAAFLLSYCHYQNGYPSVIYYYEWIAYNMALQLGLYETTRQLTENEKMLVWSIYYCNAWYKALQASDGSGTSQGLSQCKPNCPLPSVLVRPDPWLFDKEQPDPTVVRYYVWNTWVYLIQLQVYRDQTMARLVGSSSFDGSLPQDLIVMQETLKEFHTNLPTEWQTPNLERKDNKPVPCSRTPTDNFTINVKSFSQYCIQLVCLHYHVNEIMLYQAFIPVDKPPITTISSHSLETSLNAADTICRLFELMVKQKEACHVPLVGFLFANIVYRKLVCFGDNRYYETGKNGLLRSIEISKCSINYTYDFEMTRTLVNVMEQDINDIIMQYASNVTSSADSSPSIPSLKHYAIKNW